jgi:hypothetical protein
MLVIGTIAIVEELELQAVQRKFPTWGELPFQRLNLLQTGNFDRVHFQPYRLLKRFPTQLTSQRISEEKR